MGEIKGAEAVVKVLEDLAVDIVFGYPGGANLPLYDALSKQTKIKHILSRHEQGAGFMANGYARVKNYPGVCFATSGPGVTNIFTALADAFLDSVPVLAITGQIPRSFVGTDAFQEIDTFNSTIPFTKHNSLIYDENDLVHSIRSSFYIANSGRKGPTLVDIPRDVQDKKQNYNIYETRPIKGYNPTLHPHIGQIKRSIRAIKQSKRPIIIAGGGVIAAGAKQLLLELVETTGIQVVRTLMGKSVMPEIHNDFIGMIGTHGNVSANRAITQCDLIIAIGTRFSDRSTMQKKEYFAKEAVIIHIDIDPSEVGKIVNVDIPIVADIKESLSMLLNSIAKTNFIKKQAWVTNRNTNNILWKGEEGELIGKVMHELSNIDEPLHITTDVGRHQMWATHYCSNPKHWPILTSGGLGSMGFGLPAAIGCWMADPSKPVVNITGDGSFYMNMQEFLTAVEHKVPLTVLIINDNKLGMIRELQATRYGHRYFSHAFKNEVDFVKLAQAMGAEGIRITDYSLIATSFRKAIFSQTPTIIDFDLYKVAASMMPQLKAV